MTNEAIQKWLDERVHIMPQQFFFGAVVRFEDALEAIRLARASEREAGSDYERGFAEGLKRSCRLIEALMNDLAIDKNLP